MIRARSPRPLLASALRVESRRFRGLFERYLTWQLNRVFDLSASGMRRRQLRVLLSVLVFALLGFGAQLLLSFQLRPSADLLPELGSLAPAAFITGLRMILVVGIATSVGLQVAGRFLADIFELKDARIAWRYVGRLAAGSGEEVLHLREGRVSDADKDSPVVRIGGPGRVVADYETAALFEKPDGTPHVVGPLKDGDRGSGDSAAGAVLDGFERLREPVLSLRDQYIGDPSGEPLTVVGRSLDGMPISVADVRGVFSVRRDVPQASSNPPSRRPFPFRARDIESLIYNQTVPVLTSGDYPSGLPGDWTATMHVLIRDSLGEFMSQNRLAEYLAGVGAHEVERSEFRADAILSKTLQVASDAPEPASPPAASPPRFHPRTELSAKFKKYGSEFSRKAQESGLELHWIGVGTWRMPDESSETAVSEKHLEAWRLNRENAQRSESEALERVAEGTLLETKIRLIQDVPIARHDKNKSRYTDKTVLLECMLQDFWEQLGDALDLQYRGGSPAADVEELEAAVLKIESLLRVSQVGYVLGGGTLSRVRRRARADNKMEAPPAPASRGEAAKYQVLLGKLQGDYRVAEAMIANERRRHKELSREQLIDRIVQRFERHGR